MNFYILKFLMTNNSSATQDTVKAAAMVGCSFHRIVLCPSWFIFHSDLYFADPSYFLVLPALRCCFGLDSSELSAELESSSTCNTVSDSR